MTIASEITRLQNDKAAICTAIENKGVTVWNVTLDNYAACIDAIPTWSSSKFADVMVVWWWGGGGTTCNALWWWWGWAWWLAIRCRLYLPDNSYTVVVWAWGYWWTSGTNGCNWGTSCFWCLVQLNWWWGGGSQCWTSRNWANGWSWWWWYGNTGWSCPAYWWLANAYSSTWRWWNQWWSAYYLCSWYSCKWWWGWWYGRPWYSNARYQLDLNWCYVDCYTGYWWYWYYGNFCWANACYAWWWGWWGGCGCYWWWNWASVSCCVWMSATTYWSWWWWGCCRYGWWNWRQWIVIVRYPSDWSYWINCATWWTVTTCTIDWTEYKIHKFTTNWTFTIVS